MTSTVNGVGTHLSGVRHLTEEEIKRWSEHFPYIHRKVTDYLIATESFVFFFIPIIPIRTFIFYYVKNGFMSSQYVILYYPSGEGKVYWNHVLNSFSFYIAPLIILGVILLTIFS